MAPPPTKTVIATSQCVDGECCCCVSVKIAVVGTQLGPGRSDGIAACIQDVVRHLEVIIFIDKNIVVEFLNLIGITFQSLY